MLRRDADTAQQCGQMVGIGKEAAGATLSNPPAVAGLVTVDRARNVTGLEGRSPAALCGADVNDQNRGICDMV